MSIATHSQRENYILLGPPGSGKSTQANRLKEKHQLSHIDIGGELRRLAESDTDLGKLINEIINIRKELVPDGLIGDVLTHVLQGIESESGILIDGAPRRVSQIDEVEDALATQQREIHKVIFLDLESVVAVKRISTRWLCVDCKNPYIGTQAEIAALGVCQKCGGTISQRKDDTEEGVQKRYQVFMEETRPVIEYYRNLGKLIQIDASLSPEQVSDCIEQSLV